MIDNWGDSFQELQRKANSVSLIKIANQYGLDLKRNNKLCCPFPNHKGGREKTASFIFYQETNSYYCFGCKLGNKPVDFVSNMDNISKKDSIAKILKEYKDFTEEIENYDNCIELHVEFSNFVRPLIQDGLNIDEYLKAFDIIVNENSISRQQLEKLIFKVKQKIKES